MPAYMNIIDAVTGQTVKVTLSRELSVALSAIEANAGFVKMLDAVGEGLHVTDTGALLTSGREVTLFEQVDGANLNTNRWTTSVSGMTVAQTGGYINLNAGSAVAANAYAILQSIKNVPLYGALPVLLTANVKATVLPQSNITMEWGVGSVTANAAPTDGCFFRWNSNGNFQCVTSYGGSETIVDAITPPAINDATLMEIEIVEDAVAFFIGDTEVAIVTIPLSNSYPTSSGRLPVFMRVYNGSSTPAQAPQLGLGQLTVVQQDVQQRRDWATVLASTGLGAYQSPVTPFGQTANHANSTSPASAVLSNTAASYATLGGRFQFAAVAAAATDFALFAYQVPPGYQFYVTGISISALVTGTALLSATVLDWSLGINGSAVSLATVDSPPASWAPRRITLGSQGFLALVGVGAVANDITRQFSPPLVVDSNRFLHVILQVPLGAATGSLIFRGDVMLHGYFE